MEKTITGSSFAGLLLLALGACAPEAAESGRSNNSASADAGAVANAGVTTPAPPAAPAARPPLVLEGGGLGIAGASPPRMLAFDTPKAATIEAVAKALRRPPTELGENEECGGGGLEHAEWKDEIRLYFQDGRFVGWENAGKLKTSGGIGTGSSRADVAKLPGFEVEESTLGTEFRSGGGLSGLLASKAPDARVTDLWGGDICTFR